MQHSRQRLRRVSVCLLALALSLLTSCRQPILEYPAAYHEYAYVTNGTSHDVSVIDMRSFKTIKTIPVGRGPTGIAASPTKNEVYVVDSETNDLKVIDAEQNAVVATILLGRSPYFVDVSTDGTRAYVADAGSNQVSVIDLAGRRRLATVAVGFAPGLARVSPDGAIAVVSNRNGDSVALIDTEKMKVRATVFICSQPTDIAILPDSSKAFVACTARAEPESATSKKGKKAAADDTVGQVAVIDLTSDKLISLLDVGKTPVNLALKPDGGEMFVSNFGSDTVSTIETGSNDVSSAQPMGGNPVRGVVSADNSLLYVSNFGSDSVSVYSIQNGKFLKSIAVGHHPDAIALQPARDGKQFFLLVADSGSNDVAVIFANPNKGSWSLFTMIPVGIEPRQIAVKAFTRSQK